jgi:hypothetical protein
MSKAFSCVLLKSGKVLWEAGIDSHDKLLTKHNIVDDTSDGYLIKLARIEITPDDGYLYPESNWTFRVDENTTLRWITPKKKQACYDALEQWKKYVYSKINLEEARNPINPFKLPKRIPTPEDIELLHKWAALRHTSKEIVRDAIRDTVGYTVGATVGGATWDTVRNTVWDTIFRTVKTNAWDTVWDTIWATIWAYAGSLFNIEKWGNYPAGTYPFQPALDLWKRGLVPSYDGKTWRLHSGEKGEVVYKEAIK